MVLGLLSLAAIPTAIGTAEAVSHKNKVEQDAKRDARFAIDVFCDAQSRKRSQVHRKTIILKDSKMYVGEPQDGYPFAGFYIHYPDERKILGLVSIVSDEPPMMNWIYVDKNTLEVKYGNRTASREHIVGPWDWTDDEVGLTLEGEERFVAVEERENVWAVYYDRGDDYENLPKKKRILDISLERRLLPKDD
ncbi:MAG: hypothetical protein M1816_002766 [Peltula sp. TS41687]|nr:MAG: hypothetical protein M1816_002766 [Peltula sp. TS41687]